MNTQERHHSRIDARTNRRSVGMSDPLFCASTMATLGYPDAARHIINMWETLEAAETALAKCAAPTNPEDSVAVQQTVIRIKEILK